jgi:hypothetical protein
MSETCKNAILRIGGLASFPSSPFLSASACRVALFWLSTAWQLSASSGPVFQPGPAGSAKAAAVSTSQAIEAVDAVMSELFPKASAGGDVSAVMALLQPVHALHVWLTYLGLSCDVANGAPVAVDELACLPLRPSYHSEFGLLLSPHFSLSGVAAGSAEAARVCEALERALRCMSDRLLKDEAQAQAQAASGEAPSLLPTDRCLVVLIRHAQEMGRQVPSLVSTAASDIISRATTGSAAIMIAASLHKHRSSPMLPFLGLVEQASSPTSDARARVGPAQQALQTGRAEQWWTVAFRFVQDGKPHLAAAVAVAYAHVLEGTCLGRDFDLNSLVSAAQQAAASARGGPEAAQRPFHEVCSSASLLLTAAVEPSVDAYAHALSALLAYMVFGADAGTVAFRRGLRICRGALDSEGTAGGANTARSAYSAYSAAAVVSVQHISLGFLLAQHAAGDGEQGRAAATALVDEALRVSGRRLRGSHRLQRFLEQPAPATLSAVAASLPALAAAAAMGARRGGGVVEVTQAQAQAASFFEELEVELHEAGAGDLAWLYASSYSSALQRAQVLAAACEAVPSSLGLLLRWMQAELEVETGGASGSSARLGPALKPLLKALQV